MSKSLIRTSVAFTAVAAMLLFHGQASAALINVAAGKATSTSSDPFGLPPSNAVDGYIEGAGAITHTGTNGAEFWQVDLGSAFDLDFIELFNRTDGYGDRLNGAIVTILDASSSTLFTSVAIADGAGTLLYTLDNGGAGFAGAQYIRVDQATNYLSLAQVRAYSDQPLPAFGDLASLLGTASQSTTLPSTLAHRYISSNGNDATVGTFTHTDTDDITPAYEVDLGDLYGIEEINLVTRVDCCLSFGAGERDYNLTIEVLDASNQVVYASSVINPWDGTGTATEVGDGAEFNLDLVALTGGAVDGQTVRIVKSGFSGTEYLSVGDLEVFGSTVPVPEPSTGVLLVLGMLGWVVRKKRRAS